MRSLVLSPELPFPSDHGGRSRSRVLLSALAQESEVHLAAPLGRHDSKAADHLATASGILLHALPAGGDHTSASRKLSRWVRGRSERFWRRWPREAFERVRDLLVRTGFDCVVADSSFVLPLLPADMDRPLLFHPHQLESALFSSPARLPVRHRVTRLFESRMLARAEAVAAERARLTIAQSAEDRDHLRSIAPGAVLEVVESSVDLAELRPLPPPRAPDAPSLLFTGSFAYPPNVEAAIRLLRDHLPVLRARFPSLRVRLVGRDGDGKVRALARRAGVAVSSGSDDLREHFAAATAVYLPASVAGVSRVHVLEAFALGRPVLATRAGVAGLGAEPGRHYLPCDEPEQGVQGLEQVVAGAAVSMVAAARRLCEQRFGQAAAIDAMRALFRRDFGVAAVGARDS